jgi:hypothetical protein
MLGLRTVIYHVGDIARGKKWHSDALGILPYFDQPYYVGFQVASVKDPFGNLLGIIQNPDLSKG